jgi:hypothetical protein
MRAWTHWAGAVGAFSLLTIVVAGCGESTTSCDTAADCPDGMSCADGICVTPSATGACESDAECDDGIACTTDACMAGRCRSMPDHLACPEGALCSAADGCIPGQVCETDVECDDGVFCDGAERCIAGRCAPGLAVDCDDEVGCTIDVCDEGAGA